MMETESQYGRSLRLVRDLIHERLGLYYDLQRGAVLEDKLAPVLASRKVDSVLDYYYFLKDEGDDAWEELASALTVNETWFWRETDQIAVAAEKLIPSLLERRDKVRIWHAACATGEECYSLAIMLHRQAAFLRGAIEIVATDVDRAVLERARAGIYAPRALRNLPLDVRDQYFDEDRGRWVLRESIRRRVQFDHVNLVNRAAIRSLGQFDVIFCRNVFIYFSPTVIQAVVETFERQMRQPGWLFLGASETLLKIATGLRLVEVDGAFAYTNEGTSPR